MLKDREKLYQAYHTVLSMALTWALILVINQYFTLKVPIALSAVFSFAPTLFLYLFELNRKNIISYIILGSIIPLLALIFWIKKFNPIQGCLGLLNWCKVYDGTEELYKAGYADFVICFAALLGAVLFYLLMKKQSAKIISAVIIMVVIIAFSIGKVYVSKVVVGISIFYILTIIVELFGIIYSKREGRQEKKEGILYLAPICVLLAVLSVILPSKPEPIEWKVVKNAYHSIKEQLDIWKTDMDYYFGNSESEFFLSLTGYSEENGKLSNNRGEIVKDPKVALKVSGQASDESVYLTGSISDIYTGYSWEKSHQDYISGNKEYFLDYMELFYALSRQDLEVLINNRFVERNELKINYNNIKTKTFFYPLKTSYYELFSKYKKVNTEPAQITFGKARGKGTAYKSIYFQMNLNGKAFVQMLRDADSFSYDNASTINRDTAYWLQDHALNKDNIFDLVSNNDTYQLLGKRADLIRSSYTKLPEELPDRVKQLAEDITANYDTTYDKLKAIEAYLMEYTYTLEPQKVPKGEDFTDYFLFEEKKGYCTSFATAMAVMGRCIGVPTRYVEGFVAKFDGKATDGIYPVKNSQAHAWAEAYIEGVGWIPFEATASYYSNRYTEWADLSSNNAGDANYSNPYDDYYSQQQKNYQPKNNIVAAEAKGNANEILNSIIILLAVIVSLLLTVIIYYYVLRYRYKKAFEKAGYSGKMYMLFLRILKLLKREGLALEQQETILMLSKRVKDHFHYDRVTFNDVANIFMRYRYAETEVTKEEFNQVNVFYLGLSNKQKEEESRFKVWLEEFIFLAKKSNHS